MELVDSGKKSNRSTEIKLAPVKSGKKWNWQKAELGKKVVESGTGKKR